MLFTVAKAFRTPTRRFAAGATVTAADVAGAAPVDRLVALGHLAPLSVPDSDPVEPGPLVADDPHPDDAVGAVGDQPSA